jgi:hypothetical protein
MVAAGSGAEDFAEPDSGRRMRPSGNVQKKWNVSGNKATESKRHKRIVVVAPVLCEECGMLNINPRER